MYARLTMVTGDPDKADEGIASFNDKVVPAAKSVDGYRGALLLLDRSSGKGYGMTLWETEEARANAAEVLDPARQAAIETMGASPPPLEELEVGAIDMP